MRACRSKWAWTGKVPLADRRTVLSFLKCQVVRDALLDFGADLLEVESAERVLVSPCVQAPLFAVALFSSGISWARWRSIVAPAKDA